MSNFKFNEKAVRELANDAVAKKARELQRVLHSTFNSRGQKTADQIARVLRMKLRGEVSDDVIKNWATAMADGQRIELKPGKT